MASSSSLHGQQTSTLPPSASNDDGNHNDGPRSRGTDDTPTGSEVSGDSAQQHASPDDSGMIPPRRSRGNRRIDHPATGNDSDAEDDPQEIEVSIPAQSGGRLPMPCYHAPDGSYELPPTHTIDHSIGWTPYNCHCGCIALWPTC